MKKTTPFAVPAVLIFSGGSILGASSYQEDVAFLKQHTEIIELGSGAARVAIAPAYQGRVMTSSATGPDGSGFGWINPEVIAVGVKPEAERSESAKHIHVFGGEERLWFGPEGGPFALFFPPKVKQAFANWKTPAAIDTEAFDVSGTPSGDTAVFIKSMNLSNRAGTVFSMEVQRTVSLTSTAEIEKLCGGALPDDVKAVAYSTANSVKNTGKAPWSKKTGAPSIWLLGMYKPTPKTTVVIPFKSGETSILGPVATTNYFGEIPETRIIRNDSVLFFKGDGKERGKLGVSPKRSRGVAGSWQADSGALTLLVIQPTTDSASRDWPYVDSQWKEDVDPFGGDLLNSYNDGPAEPGAKPLGPFYELETSSPALFLKPGQSHTHTQSTIHLTGPREALDAISLRVFGTSLDAIEHALP